jgi:hypothetical protein
MAGTAAATSVGRGQGFMLTESCRKREMAREGEEIGTGKRARRRHGAREELQGVFSSDSGSRRWRCRAQPRRCVRVRRKKTRPGFAKSPLVFGIFHEKVK